MVYRGSSGMKIVITQQHIDRWKLDPINWLDLFRIATGASFAILPLYDYNDWTLISDGIKYKVPPSFYEWKEDYMTITPITFTLVPV